MELTKSEKCRQAAILQHKNMSNEKRKLRSERISIALKGMKTWNKGLKGAQVAWNKGIPCSKETKNKLKLINIGKKYNRKETRITNCKFCNKVIKTCKSRIENNRGKFCSKKCIDLYKIKSKKEKINKLINPPLCKCGCGNKVKFDPNTFEWYSFIKNHQNKNMSDETKKKIGLANKGKKVSEETKSKLRLANLGKKLSEEHKQKLRIARSKQIFYDTGIEVKLQNALKVLSVKFETHKAILGQPDIFIEPNIVVFADGCYWHNCKECFKIQYNRYNNINRIEKDEFITTQLKSEGYIVLRFWEHDINKNFEEVITEIKQVIGEK